MRNQTILIADDIPQIRKVIVNLIHDLGFTTIEAVNGEEILKALEINAVNLILTDIEMPEMNGIESATIIRNEFSWPKCQVPIIAITSFSCPSIYQQCINAGINKVLTKPIQPNEIIEIVLMYCNSSF